MATISFRNPAVSAVPASSDTFADGTPKAKGFINIYVPRNDGTRYKLAGIPVVGTNPTEQEMLALLATPEGLEMLLGAMEFDYKAVGQPNASGIALKTA